MNKLNKNRSSVLCFHRWTRKGYAIFASLHRVVKIAVVTFTCTLVQQSQVPVVAQARANSAMTDSVNLEEIEITGDLPLALPQSTRTMQVVQQREIQSSPAQNLSDLLENLAGLDIRQRGSEVQSDVSIRGGSFDQVLILLNGNNITDPQTGHFNLDLPVNLENIQRIEVLQGSAARIWGPNAFSGVINIVTNAPSDKLGSSLKTQIAYGSFGQMLASGTYRYDAKKWLTSLSGQYKKSDGYQNNTDYNTFNTNLEIARNDENIGNFQFQVGYQQKDFGANSFYTFAYPNQYERGKTLFGSLNWQKLLGNTLISARLNERIHHDRFELFRDGLNATSWYSGHNYHLTNVSQGDINLIRQSFLGKTFAGIEIRNEHILSNVLGETRPQPIQDKIDKLGTFTKEKSRTNTRLYADQTLYLMQLSLSGGISINYNSDFDWFTTGGIDAGYQLSHDLKLQASWNHALRMPTFTDLYYKSATQISNPNLKPEQSNTFDVNVQYSKNQIKLFASAFYRAGKNVIDWVKLPDSTKWNSRNETAIDAYGGDLSVEYNPKNFFLKSVRFSNTLLNMDKAASGYDSKYALDYLNFKSNIRLEHAICDSKTLGDFTAVWNFNYQERSGTYTKYPTTTLVNYTPSTLCDVRFNWKKGNLNVYLDAKNLFNEQYADFGGLTQPGRSILTGIRFTL